MKVRDVMAADVRTVPLEGSVAQAARQMAEARIGFVPVVDGDAPVGVITDRDIVVRFVAGGGGDATAVPVSEVMTSTVRTIGPDEDIGAAGDAMRDAAVRRLVVVERGAVVGVLSHGALVQATGGEGPGREATLAVTAGA